MADSYVITTHKLVRCFGDLTAVNELTFEVAHGEVFGFLGHNGAGKTTTIRLLNGVLIPNGGEARVLGYDPLKDGSTLRRRTGILTENPSLDERLTARENLRVYADLYGVPEANVSRRIGDLLGMFELEERADERVGGYSKGMKQRLALARALLHEPELLFLDEPTSGLDPVAARDVHNLITRLSREEGRTIFLCTHNLAEAQKLCHRVAVLEHGRVLALGTPTELAQKLGHRLGLEVVVELEDVPAALEVLRGMPKLSQVSHFGDMITISGAARSMIPNMLSGLVGAGIRVYRVTPQETSLEDVYFALHSEDNADGKGASS